MKEIGGLIRVYMVWLFFPFPYLEKEIALESKKALCKKFRSFSLGVSLVQHCLLLPHLRHCAGCCRRQRKEKKTSFDFWNSLQITSVFLPPALAFPLQFSQDFQICQSTDDLVYFSRLAKFIRNAVPAPAPSESPILGLTVLLVCREQPCSILVVRVGGKDLVEVYDTCLASLVYFSLLQLLYLPA